MINRKVAPEFGHVDDFTFNMPEPDVLSNGIKVYSLPSREAEALRLDLCFQAGSKYHEHPMVAGAANSLLTEGTRTKTGAFIAEELDALGAFIDKECGVDFSKITVYALGSQLHAILILLKEIIEQASFPENELAIYKNLKLQKLKVNQEKNNWIANKKFLQAIYPSGHYYGKTIDEQSIETLGIDAVRDFFKQIYCPEKCHIVLSGNASSEVLKTIENTLGSGDWGRSIAASATSPSKNVSIQSEVGRFHLSKENSIQAALKYGKVLFNRKHEDFYGVQILCTILGGYFGSRLMKNIREEKGYTYGIGCSLVPLADSGYFVISSEVKIDAKLLTIQEIEKEIVTLQNELVGHDEMLLVKNYLLGSFLRLFDGVFSKAERVDIIISNQLESDYYNKYLKKIKEITAFEIKELANKYLNTNDITEIIVG